MGKNKMQVIFNMVSAGWTSKCGDEQSEYKL